MWKKSLCEIYEAPQMEVIEVQVEQGFAASCEDYGDEFGNG